MHTYHSIILTLKTATTYVMGKLWKNQKPKELYVLVLLKEEQMNKTQNVSGIICNNQTKMNAKALAD